MYVCFNYLITSLNNYKSQNPNQAYRRHLQGSVSGILQSLANSDGDNLLPLQRLGAAVSGPVYTEILKDNPNRLQHKEAVLPCLLILAAGFCSFPSRESDQKSKSGENLAFEGFAFFFFFFLFSK